MVSAVHLKDPSDDSIKYGCERKHKDQLGGYHNQLGKRRCLPELIGGGHLNIC